MYTQTTTPLTGSATWTSQPRMSLRKPSITGTVFADQAGTVYVDQSFDANAENPATAGTANWDTSTSTAVTASTGTSFNVTVVAPYWRIRYVNGAAAQATFRLSAQSRGADDT